MQLAKCCNHCQEHEEYFIFCNLMEQVVRNIHIFMRSIGIRKDNQTVVSQRLMGYKQKWPPGGKQSQYQFARWQNLLQIFIINLSMQEKSQPNLRYEVTIVQGGKILQSLDYGFLICRIKDTWTAQQQYDLTRRFEQTLHLLYQIAQKIEEQTNIPVQQSLYLINVPEMLKILNGTPGMAMGSSFQFQLKGQASAVTISNEFFLGAFQGLTDVTPILGDLFERMAKAQAAGKRSGISSDFGTLIGTVSLLEGLNIITTAIRYVSCQAQYSCQFLTILCLTKQIIKYHFNISSANYLYSLPTSHNTAT